MAQIQWLAKTGEKRNNEIISAMSMKIIWRRWLASAWRIEIRRNHYENVSWRVSNGGGGYRKRRN
jgi:hypothetical protein